MNNMKTEKQNGQKYFIFAYRLIDSGNDQKIARPRTTKSNSDRNGQNKQRALFSRCQLVCHANQKIPL